MSGVSFMSQIQAISGYATAVPATERKGHNCFSLKHILVLLSISSFFLFSNISTTFAEFRSCSESFIERTRTFWGVTVQRVKQTQDNIKRVRSKISVDRWIYKVTTPKSKFDPVKFRIAKARFLYLKPQFVQLEHLQSVEELLAFIEVNSRVEGRDMVSMLTWSEYNWPSFARYIKRISQIDLSRTVYAEHVEDWIFESYWAVHGQNYINFDDIKNKTSSAKIKAYIIERSYYEIARVGLLRALKETGIVRQDNALQKIARTIKTSGAYRTILNTTIKAPIYFLTNTPLVAKLPLNQVIPFLRVPAPTMLSIRHNLLSEEFVDEALNKGVEEMLPALKRELGYAARWDNGVRFVQKSLFVTSLIAQAFLYPQLISQAYQLNVHARNLTQTNQYFEFSYPSDFTKWDLLSASAQLPLVGQVDIKTPVLTEWNSIQLKINHIYIGNPIYLVRPQYGSAQDMQERFNEFAENYFSKCNMETCSNAYLEGFLPTYLAHLPQILPDGRQNLAELIKMSTLARVSQLDRNSLGNELWKVEYSEAANASVRLAVEYNEFDRIYEASVLKNLVGEPIPPSNVSVQPSVK